MFTSDRSRSPLVSGPEDGTVRRLACVVGAVVVSLAVVSALHLSGHGQDSGAYQVDPAGIAEAVIGAVLAAAAVLMWRMGARARSSGLSAIGFAIAGFGLGLSFTARGGPWPDIAYHCAVLPVLIGCFVALYRTNAESRDPV